MKMIKLLVLLNGKSIKVDKNTKVGRVTDSSGNTLGAIYSVSKDVYKNRRTLAIKNLLTSSIYDGDTCTVLIKR